MGRSKGVHDKVAGFQRYYRVKRGFTRVREVSLVVAPIASFCFFDPTALLCLCM